MTKLVLSRRQILAGAAAAATFAALPPIARATVPARTLTATTRTLEVHGRAATVFGLLDADGRPGLVLEPGERFSVGLTNALAEPTIIHWHGQTPPWAQDGVASASVPALAPGETRRYDYAPRPGTHWMHSHLGLQEQRLLAAPLIVRTAEDAAADRQEVTVLLHDFTFRDPEELLASLGGPGGGHGGGHGEGHGGHGGHGGGHAGHGGHGAPAEEPVHANEFDYDAYLANDRTVDDPEVVRIERSGRVLLRLINGATATAFHVLTAPVTATLLAVDGIPVVPVRGDRFPLTMGQRLDLLLDLPAGSGALPVLFQREEARERAAVILAPPGATVARLEPLAAAAAPLLDLDLEQRLRRPTAAPALAAAARTVAVDLTGGMMPYAWGMTAADGGAALTVEPGERLGIILRNQTAMPHPIHLHGHSFQVVGIGGATFAGAERDTVLVPARGQVAIAFTADNPGRWPFHCHNLLHMAAGMMMDVAYPGT